MTAALALALSLSVGPRGALPRVSADGMKFIADGKPIVLRGVNLGGWFVEEMWMTPWVIDPPSGSSFAKIEDDHGLWQVIRERFGEKGLQKVEDAWRSNWITAEDFREIKAAGFNHVRIPFLAWILDEPGGLNWLKRAVRMAGEAGLYSILDMHGVRGGQSGDQPSGLKGKNDLWTSAADQVHAAKDWEVLGAAFASEPDVAAFDLMNEPMGAPNSDAVYPVYDQMYKGLRAKDSKTIALVEDGYKGFGKTPIPADMGWKQMAYSLHFYNFDAKKPEDHLNAVRRDIANVFKDLPARNVPMYVGEWNVEPFGGPSVAGPYSAELTKAGLSWALWTWKVWPGTGSLGDWGAVRPNKPVVRPNPFTDSLEELIAKIKMVRTKPGMAPAAWTTCFTSRD